MKSIQKLAVVVCAIIIHVSSYCQMPTSLTPQANQKGLFGYVNNEGKFIIKAKYVEARNFGKDALAIVAVKKGERKLYGVIDANGKFTIEPQFTKMGNFNESSKAVVEILSDDGAPLQGVINEHGNFVISPIYKSINNNRFYLYDEPRIPIKMDESYLNKYGKSFICVNKIMKKVLFLQ